MVHIHPAQSAVLPQLLDKPLRGRQKHIRAVVGQGSLYLGTVLLDDFGIVADRFADILFQQNGGGGFI